MSLGMEVQVNSHEAKPVKGLIRLELRHRIIYPDGREEVSPWVKSRSFVKQFLQILYSGLYNASQGSILDTSNTARTVFAPSGATTAWMNLNGPIATDTYGLLVGTGTNAPAVADYALQTKIAHGSSAGQLYYSAMSIMPAEVRAGSVELIMLRMFTNQTANPITIKEVGLVVNTTDTGSTARYFLITRDAYEVLVAAGAAVAIECKLSTTA